MQTLIYIIDCLRHDHVSASGYPRETTPNIDALAQDGIRYENCLTPSTWTRPTSVSLLTGTYPPTHGTRHRSDLFPTELTSLPESLSEAGFETLGVSTMGNVSDTVGHARGFDTFRNLYREDAIVRKRSNTSTANEQLLNEGRDRIALPRAEDVTDSLVPAMNTDDDLFSFAWTIDPHLPFDPPETHREFLDADYDGPVDGSFESLPDDPTPADLERLRDLYDCEISYVDDQFGAVVDALRDRDMYDDSLIVVLGDHGEAFYEHGTLFHGNVPYEEVLHVPLVVKPPVDVQSEPGVVSDVVSLVDLFPTILDVLGVENPPETLQGRVVPPFGEATDGEPVFSETQLRDFEPAYYSVRTDRWKYIETRRPSLAEVGRRMYRARDELSDTRYVLKTVRDAVLGKLSWAPDRELFDLERDPGETTNLAAERPELVGRFQRQLAEWLRDCRAANDALATADENDIDAATAEQLKQLGYVE